MSRCDIRIEFDHSDRTYAGGDTVRGRAVVQVNQDTSCRGITLEHYWRTHGRGNRDSGERQKIRLCETQPLQAGEELEFPFEFTADVWPLTYRGHYISVDHYVRVAVDVPWAIDPKQEEEFILTAGKCPPQFSGDRSGAVDLKPKGQNSLTNASWAGRILLVIVAIVLFGALFALAVFLLPLALIAGLIYWMRSSAVKRRTGEVEVSTPHIIVASGENWPGELSFTPRRTFRINGVTTRLLVQESATSGSGTNSTTHRHTLVDETQVVIPEGELVAGTPIHEQLQVPLPETQAWSFDASDNKLTWTMEVRIDIPRYPDWSHRFNLMMIPSEFVDSTNSGDEHPRQHTDRIAAETPKNGVTADRHTTDTQVSAGSIFELVTAIQNTEQHGNERSQVAQSAGQQVFDVSVIVDRVSTTLGLSDNLSTQHRDGRTVLGTIAGTNQEVQLFTCSQNNSTVDAVAREEVWQTRVQVARWDTLYHRLVLLET